MTTEGIDISSSNPPVDGAAIYKSGRRFAWVRVAAGTVKDSHFAEHLRELQGSGLLVGAYLFDQPDADEHEVIGRTMDALGGIELDMPLAVDVEIMGHLAPAKFADRLALLEAEAIDAHGRSPLMYTGPGFWSMLGVEGKRPAFAALDLWVAHYGVSKPSIPAPWSAWKFWQHHANTIWWLNGTTGFGSWRMPKGARVIAQPGVCPGVLGEVDLDTFNGTEDELRAWASPSAASPAASPMPRDTEPPERAAA